MTSLSFLTFTFRNSYILKHLRLETLTFSDVTLSDAKKQQILDKVLSEISQDFKFFAFDGITSNSANFVPDAEGTSKEVTLKTGRGDGRGETIRTDGRRDERKETEKRLDNQERRRALESRGGETG